LDGVVAAFVERDLFVQLSEFPIDPCTHKAFFVQLFKFLLELALTAADDRCEDHHPLTGRQLEYAGDDLLDRLARYRLAALVAMRLADRRKKQAEIVVDLRYGAYGRTGRARDGLLLDRYGGT